MTQTEFQEWIEYHCLAFPKLREDFAANVRNGGQWYRALKRVRIKAAKEATDEMLGEGVPYGEHVATVKSYAKKHNGIEGEAEAPRKLWGDDGQRVYTCWRCKDSGHNSIFRPKVMFAMRDSQGRFGPIYPSDLVTCACDCDWGKKVGYVQRLPVYDRTLHVRWEGDDRDAIERLAAFYGLPMPELIRPTPYERPANVKPTWAVAQTAPEKPLASLLPLGKATGPVSAVEPERVYDESEAEGPWTPDDPLPF